MNFKLKVWIDPLSLPQDLSREAILRRDGTVPSEWFHLPEVPFLPSDMVKNLDHRVQPPQPWRRCFEKTHQSVRKRRRQSQQKLEWRRSSRERWRGERELPAEEEHQSVEDIGKEEGNMF